MAHPIQATQAQDTTTVARLTGSLTVLNAPDLRIGLLEAIKTNKPKVLALNLAGVDFVDSSALGVFVEARRQMTASDGSVTFTNVNDDIRGLMRIMNLESVFDFVDDEGEVLGSAE
ncbi:MAG: STAS domain-containing protein [Phycisphaeraceae bacterium]|nr:STAS domain-containing protein [Phycisphaeraceae bacterium]